MRSYEYETRVISDAKFGIVRFVSTGCRTLSTVSSALTIASVSSRLPGTFISVSLQKERLDESDLGNGPEIQPGLRIGVFG